MEFGTVLKGVKVVELATYAAAPAAARLLADWGADVIKIEGPGSDPMRAFSANACNAHSREENPIYQFENANKKGIALDLKKPEAKEILFKLLETADVFVSNTRLQALTKLGLDYDTLHVKFPRLVWAHVGGYGNEGPDSAKPGFDITAYWSRSGGLMDTSDASRPGNPPSTSPWGAGDHTLSLGLAAGILAALLKQRQTGEGEKVIISLLGTATWAFAMTIVSTQYGDVWPKSRLKPMNPLNASYRCKDGEWFMSTVIEYERMFAKCMKILGLDHLIDDPRYNTYAEVVKEDRRTEMVKMIDEAFAKQDRDYWIEQYNANDVPSESVKHFVDVHKDPQVWANGYLSKFKFENGHEAAIPCSPVQFAANVASPCERAPHVGEHNVEVLKACGYSDAEIEELHKSGAVFKM